TTSGGVLALATIVLAIAMVGMSLSLFATSLYEPLGITLRDSPCVSRNLMRSSSIGRIFIFRASDASWMAAPGTARLAKKMSMFRSRYWVTQSLYETRMTLPPLFRTSLYVVL